LTKNRYSLFRGGQIKVRCHKSKGFKPSQITVHGLNRNILEHCWHFSDPGKKNDMFVTLILTVDYEGVGAAEVRILVTLLIKVAP